MVALKKLLHADVQVENLLDTVPVKTCVGVILSLAPLSHQYAYKNMVLPSFGKI